MPKKTTASSPPVPKVKACVVCGGTGLVCHICHGSSKECECDVDDVAMADLGVELGAQFESCEDCGGTGE